jgi:hypothetical protein
MLPVSLDCHFLIALYSLTFVYIKKNKKKNTALSQQFQNPIDKEIVESM